MGWRDSGGEGEEGCTHSLHSHIWLHHSVTLSTLINLTEKIVITSKKKLLLKIQITLLIYPQIPMTLQHGCTVCCSVPNTAGISLYRDCLYRNLYVMPIYDVQNCV